MFKTLYLGTLQGAKIYIHWSFWLLAIFIFFSGLSGGVGRAFALLGFVLAVFACVFLHELGHAMAAKAFGRKTRDITLLPIGGVARIEGGELSPVAEGWVAIAGPAVSFAIALALMIGMSLFSISQDADGSIGQGVTGGTSMESVGLDTTKMARLHPMDQLIFANWVLAIFNLIPAFPLDGGRVLRSVLCYWYSRTLATRIASRVGQFASGLLILTSIVWWSFMGIIFGILLYLVNTAQRFQAHFVGDPADMQRTGPFQPFPFNQEQAFGGQGPNNDKNTIDALDVREVHRS